MSRNIIVTTVDHHSATKALARITALLDFSQDGYAVEHLEYRVHEPGFLVSRMAGVIGDHSFFTTDVLGDHPDQPGRCNGVDCSWTGTEEEHDRHLAEKIVGALG